VSKHYCEVCDREFANALGLSGHQRSKAHLALVDGGSNVPRETSGEFTGDSGGEASGEERRPGAEQRPGGEEHAPAPRPGLLDRLTGKNRPKLPATKEKRPGKPVGRRVATAGLWSDAVGFAATGAARAGQVPLSRAMAWTSPVAGEIIEDATKGTFVDRVAQPLARNYGRWDDLGALLGVWAGTAYLSQNPESPIGFQMVRGGLKKLLPKIAQNVKKEAERERQAAEAITVVLPDLFGPDVDLGDDPLTGLVNMLFAPVPGEPPAEEVPVNEPAVA
jgi:hypothetical protein